MSFSLQGTGMQKKKKSTLKYNQILRNQFFKDPKGICRTENVQLK